MSLCSRQVNFSENSGKCIRAPNSC